MRLLEKDSIRHGFAMCDSAYSLVAWRVMLDVGQTRIRNGRKDIWSHSRRGSVEIGNTWTVFGKRILILEVLHCDGGKRAIVYAPMVLPVEHCVLILIMMMGFDTAHRPNRRWILVVPISSCHSCGSNWSGRRHRGSLDETRCWTEESAERTVRIYQ